MELSADYEQEQRELKDRAAALQEELSKSQAATVNARGWGSWMAKSAIMPFETNCCSQNSRTRTAYWPGGISLGTVSYTHLDVYKRQISSSMSFSGF